MFWRKKDVAPEPEPLVFSKHYVAEHEGRRWTVYDLSIIPVVNSYSNVFEVQSRENAVAIMARLDEIKDRKGDGK